MSDRKEIHDRVLNATDADALADACIEQEGSSCRICLCLVGDH